MATKNTTLRNKMSDDFGSLWNSGTLVLKTAGGATVATFSFGATAFGAADTGKIAATGMPWSVQASAQGIITQADMLSSGSTYQITGLTVGTSASQIVVDNTNANEGQTINITKFEWTESATV